MKVLITSPGEQGINFRKKLLIMDVVLEKHDNGWVKILKDRCGDFGAGNSVITLSLCKEIIIKNQFSIMDFKALYKRKELQKLKEQHPHIFV